MNQTVTIALSGDVGLDLIYCPPDSFLMGSEESESGRDTDEPRHSVVVERGFWFGKFPVTRAQWFAVMGGEADGDCGGELPVANVSWHDSAEFCKKLSKITERSFRLPTEVEWEYACRAGTITAYSWGDALDGKQANCNGEHPCGTSESGPWLRCLTSVGIYAPNPWGFCDMHGNVKEWCADWYDPITRRYKILRGGSWADDAQDCRSAFRDREEPGTKAPQIGFRVCCDGNEADFQWH